MTVTKEAIVRCEGCGLFKIVCICPHIKELTLATRLTLLIHVKEVRRTSNTGRLADLCLENSQMFIRGKKDMVWDEAKILPEGYEHRILFPNATRELTPDMAHINGKPLNLIVPDGTWPQAKRIIISEPYLRNVKRVRLPVDKPSSYILRKSKDPERISTLEAIAAAFGILENADVQEHLEHVFTRMTGNLIKLRGY